MIKETKFGDIVLWNKNNEKFVAIRNYYKLPNLLKTSEYEICCMSIGNGSFVSLNETDGECTWYEAIEKAKDYNGLAPIKKYLPSISELKSFYPFIKEFNKKIHKLKSLGIECGEISMWYYWSSTKYNSSYACSLDMEYGDVGYVNKNNGGLYVRAFVAF